METKVKVTVDLVVTHSTDMPQDKIAEIAMSDIHHSRIGGVSLIYGSYKVEEHSREAYIDYDSELTA